MAADTPLGHAFKCYSDSNVTAGGSKQLLIVLKSITRRKPPLLFGTIKLLLINKSFLDVG
jgi:hypothetical protein